MEMTPEKPTIIFVPGAWNYPSYYQLVIDRLHTHNYPTATVNLASVIDVNSGPDVPRAESHHADAEAIKAVVKPFIDAGKSIIVLCHSYGGVPTSEALAGLGKISPSAGGVTNIIYCTSFVIPEGESLVSARAKFPPSKRSDWNTLDDDGLTLRVSDYDKMNEELCADVEDGLVKKYIKVGLQSVKTFLSPLEKAVWREIPTTFIFCEDDLTIPPHVQQFIIDEAGIKDVVKLRSSHTPFLSMPDEVFGVIDRVAGSTKSFTVNNGE